MINKSKLASILKDEGLIKTGSPRVKRTKSKITIGSGNDYDDWTLKGKGQYVVVSQGGWGGNKTWLSPDKVEGEEKAKLIKDTMDQMEAWVKQKQHHPANYGQQMDWFFKKNRWRYTGSARYPELSSNPFSK